MAASNVGAEERLEQIEEMLSRHEAVLRQILERLDQQAAPRRATPKPMPVIDLVPMKEEDIVIGGQYMFKVANPRRPYYARAMILGHTEDPKTGTVLFRFVRADTSRTFQPRPASDFFKLPKDWKDPTEVVGEEEDEGSTRPATSRPLSNKSTRPARTRNG